jgi:hypothetical protein
MRKLFTLEEANQTLPLVRKIASRIVEEGRRLEGLAGIGPGSPKRGKIEIRRQGHIKQLNSLGCEWQSIGMDRGQVDFPSKIADRSVILCWRPGERNIKKYREPSEGISHTHILPRNGVTY